MRYLSTLTSLVFLAFLRPAMADESIPTEVHAGPISAIFRDGQLCYLCAGGKEVVRRIYFAVRDDAWNTVPPAFTRCEVTKQDEESFVARLEANCQEGPVSYMWQGTITGTASGDITFEARGTAHSDFKSNRIGLCLLFGAEALAGEKFEASLENGEVKQGEFPKLVTPELLVKNATQIRCSTADLVQVTARSEGALFSMEDQRNYGDSSFKAFAPLVYEYPDITEGMEARESLVLSFLGAPRPAKGGTHAARVVVGDVLPEVHFPKIVAPSEKPALQFSAINRDRDAYANQERIAFPYNPTTHLRDGDTLMENLPAIADEVATIRSFAPKSVITLDPVGFNSRRKGVMTDARNETPFGAVWVAAALKTMALAGVDEAALAVDGDPAREMEAELLSHPDLRYVGTRIESGCHKTIEALCLEEQGKRRLWVFNLTDEIQEFGIQGYRPMIPLQPYEIREIEQGRKQKTP